MSVHANKSVTTDGHFVFCAASHHVQFNHGSRCFRSINKTRFTHTCVSIYEAKCVDPVSEIGALKWLFPGKPSDSCESSARFGRYPKFRNRTADVILLINCFELFTYTVSSYKWHTRLFQISRVKSELYVRVKPNTFLSLSLLAL